MTKKTLADVINNQNSIIVTLKSLEKYIENIHTRLVKMEDSNEENSLSKMKDCVIEYLKLIRQKD